MPVMEVTYWGFRMMIGFGALAALAAARALWVTRQGPVPASRWLMRLAVLGILAPFVANAPAGSSPRWAASRSSWSPTRPASTRSSCSPRRPSPGRLGRRGRGLADRADAGVRRARWWSRSCLVKRYVAAGYRRRRHVRCRRRHAPAGDPTKRPRRRPGLRLLRRSSDMDLPHLWFIAIAVLWTRLPLPRGLRLRRRDAAAGARDATTRAPGPAQHDRPGLGRQRGLAADRRRCHLRGLPALVRSLFAALYLPLLLVLLALIFRGGGLRVPRQGRHRPRGGARWDLVIIARLARRRPSASAPCSPTTAGLPLDANGDRVGGAFAWFGGYAVLGGLAVVWFSLVHGAAFLALKTDGDVRQRARDAGVALAAGRAAAAGRRAARDPDPDGTPVGMGRGRRGRGRRRWRACWPRAGREGQAFACSASRLPAPR